MVEEVVKASLSGDCVLEKNGIVFATAAFEMTVSREVQQLFPVYAKRS